MNEAIRMQVSAFVDGELPDNEAELLVRRLSQDSLLRKQVAEYLAIGRVMRGEHSVQGTDALRDRIAAELDAGPLQDVVDETVPAPTSRYLRPLAGLAIAASVALIAIIGLQQVGQVDVADPEAQAEVDLGTEPMLSPEDLELYRFHIENSVAFDARWTSVQIRAEELEDEAAEDDDASDDESDEPVNDQP